MLGRVCEVAQPEPPTPVPDPGAHPAAGPVTDPGFLDPVVPAVARATRLRSSARCTSNNTTPQTRTMQAQSVPPPAETPHDAAKPPGGPRRHDLAGGPDQAVGDALIAAT
jgi:hypothetical protein